MPVTMSHHSAAHQSRSHYSTPHHSGVITIEAILIVLFATLSALFQCFGRLLCRPGFAAGQSRDVALIRPDAGGVAALSYIKAKSQMRYWLEIRLGALASLPPPMSADPIMSAIKTWPQTEPHRDCRYGTNIQNKWAMPMIKMLDAARNRIWGVSNRANMGTSPVPHPNYILP
jgi:hypothetical protein